MLDPSCAILPRNKSKSKYVSSFLLQRICDCVKLSEIKEREKKRTRAKACINDESTLKEASSEKSKALSEFWGWFWTSKYSQAEQTSRHGSETYKSQTYLNWLNYSSAPHTHQEKGFNRAEENSKAKGEKHKSQPLAHLKSSLAASPEKPLQQGGREVEKIQKRREAAPPPPRHHRVASYHLLYKATSSRVQALVRLTRVPTRSGTHTSVKLRDRVGEPRPFGKRTEKSDALTPSRKSQPTPTPQPMEDRHVCRCGADQRVRGRGPGRKAQNSLAERWAQGGMGGACRTTEMEYAHANKTRWAHYRKAVGPPSCRSCGFVGPALELQVGVGVCGLVDLPSAAADEQLPVDECTKTEEDFASVSRICSNRGQSKRHIINNRGKQTISRNFFFGYIPVYIDLILFLSLSF